MHFIERPVSLPFGEVQFALLEGFVRTWIDQVL
jgi:hypothetical protein